MLRRCMHYATSCPSAGVSEKEEHKTARWTNEREASEKEGYKTSRWTKPNERAATTAVDWLKCNSRELAKTQQL